MTKSFVLGLVVALGLVGCSKKEEAPVAPAASESSSASSDASATSAEASSTSAV